jgi:cell division protein FtsB
MKKRKSVRFWVVVITVFFLLISIPRIKKLVDIYNKLERYRTENERILSENAVLKEKIEKIQKDPFYAEKYLRENYGLIKEGELIFRIEKE